MNSPRTRGHLLFSLRRALRSLAHLLIRAGVRYEEFAALAREVYIESAIRDIDHPNTPSRERISALTGLTCGEVNYYIENESALHGSDTTMRAFLTEVLHKWHTSPEYVGPYGIPLELDFSTPVDRCFRSLVALVDPEANPASTLQELLRVGAVSHAGEKHFRANTRSLIVPEALSHQVIEHFTERLSRLAATQEYNMNPKYADRWLDRHVIADRGLPDDLVPEFEKYAGSRIALFLSDLDNWLATQVIDDSTGGERIDTGVNVFLYVKPSGDEPPLAGLVKASGSKRSANR